jgi:DNA ligase (NAD+)
MSDQQRHVELSQELADAQYRYHALDAPVISDAEYDVKMRELLALEEAHP